MPHVTCNWDCINMVTSQCSVAGPWPFIATDCVCLLKWTQIIHMTVWGNYTVKSENRFRFLSSLESATAIHYLTYTRLKINSQTKPSRHGLKDKVIIHMVGNGSVKTASQLHKRQDIHDLDTIVFKWNFIWQILCLQNCHNLVNSANKNNYVDVEISQKIMDDHIILHANINNPLVMASSLLISPHLECQSLGKRSNLIHEDHRWFWREVPSIFRFWTPDTKFKDPV